MESQLEYALSLLCLLPHYFALKLMKRKILVRWDVIPCTFIDRFSDYAAAQATNELSFVPLHGQEIFSSL